MWSHGYLIFFKRNSWQFAETNIILTIEDIKIVVLSETASVSCLIMCSKWLAENVSYITHSFLVTLSDCSKFLYNKVAIF